MNQITVYIDYKKEKLLYGAMKPIYMDEAYYIVFTKAPPVSGCLEVYGILQIERIRESSICQGCHNKMAVYQNRMILYCEQWRYCTNQKPANHIVYEGKITSICNMANQFSYRTREKTNDFWNIVIAQEQKKKDIIFLQTKMRILVCGNWEITEESTRCNCRWCKSVQVKKMKTVCVYPVKEKIISKDNCFLWEI